MPKAKPEELRALTRDVFHAAGVPREEAEQVAHLMVLSNIRGHDSHGVRQIPRYLQRVQEKSILAGKGVTVEKDTPSLAILNGNRSFGHFAATHAMKLAIAKARKVGIAAVGVHNLNHIGRVGAYPEMAAAEGLIGMCFVASRGGDKAQVPFGGIEPRLATAPISVGIPVTGKQPILLDFATSVVAANKVRQALDRKKPAGDGWLIDAAGKPVSDPAQYIAGKAFLNPVGGLAGHKGYGLAVLNTIFAGILTGGGTLASTLPNLGHDNLTMMIVLDPFAFVARDFYDREMTTLVAYLRNTKVRPGDPPVQVPGEYEELYQRKVEAEGIEIEQPVWDAIMKAARSVGVAMPQPIPAR
ncbi:MAG: Ldh family oxidoreductase [Candidatus Lambdaproteobacteria bacterium]|nr:Ldh family oxidoreductase [Candidatus Lambdaproteobacteria bacterium]